MNLDEAPLTLDPPIFYGVLLKCFSMRSRSDFRLSLYSIALNSKNEKLAPKRTVKIRFEASHTLDPPIFYGVLLKCFSMRSMFNFRLSLYSIALNSKNEKLAPKRIVKIRFNFKWVLSTLYSL